MKKILPIITLLLCLTACGGNGDAEKQEQDIDTIPLMVQQIRECSKLYTAEYRVHKVITHSDTTKLSGSLFGKTLSVTMPGGRRKVAIPVNASIKAYIDFSDFSAKNVQRRSDGKLEITLPTPHVKLMSSQIDHDGIKKYVSLIRSDFSDDELAIYEKQGRQAIIEDIPRMGILQTARHSAASQIIPLVSLLGINKEDIVITFVESSKEKGGITWIMD